MQGVSFKKDEVKDFLDNRIEVYERRVKNASDDLAHEKHVLKMFKKLKEFEKRLRVD